ncbi:MAG: hypothetical protein JOZ41_12800 [Chloroflexi bacterium]|nr:hypothetical protein [Chloroflexota bacterium]
MAPLPGHPDELTQHAPLPHDFTERLEAALAAADGGRRRRVALRRLRMAAVLALLAAPLVAWRLMLAFPDGVHLGIDALAWITFALDVGVHVDTALLSYLGLQALPTVVGVLLLVLVTGRLLGMPRDDR